MRIATSEPANDCSCRDRDWGALGSLRWGPLIVIRCVGARVAYPVRSLRCHDERAPNDPVVRAERGLTPQGGSSCRRPEVRADIRRGLVFAAVLLLTGYLGLTAIWAGLGLLVTGPLADSWMGTVDQDVAGWLVAHRTPVLDDWSRLGTMPADTRARSSPPPSSRPSCPSRGGPGASRSWSASR